MEIRYTGSDGVDIAYATVGDGPIDVALVPGFISHLELMWEEPRAKHFLRRLSSFARVILWDKREQGLSGRLGQAPALEQSKDDLLAVLDAAGSERPSIVGVSEGGPMAILFAASHPDRVASLALYGTYARLTRSEDFPIGMPVEVVREFVARSVEVFGTPEGVKVFAPSLRDDPDFGEFWARMMRSGATPKGMSDLFTLYESIDLREVVPSITAPTLVLHPVDDRLIPIEFGYDLAERLPDARMVELPGEDHLYFGGDRPRLDRLLDELEEFLTGQRAHGEPERVLTTVLFTDICGSTERAAELGDRRWRELLERHHEVVRRELARFDGREVGTAGDGFLARFDGAARAVRCAESIVARTGEREIPLRAGVHTGECELVNGDLAGIAVHIGARVGALAGPGEVLVSGTVKDLVVGSELRFADRGAHELRGVPGSWQLYRLSG